MNDERYEQTRAGARGEPARGAGGADPHAPPPGARTMNLVRWGLLIGLAVFAAASIGLAVFAKRDDAANTAATTATYHCPMHPTYTSDGPGTCPICNMDLEPIPASGQATADSAIAGDVPGLVGVTIEPERIQRIGVRTAVVGHEALGAGLSLVASVTPDESRLRRIQLRVAGWVRELHVSRTGEAVRAGQPLLSLYSPELYQTETEFLIELEAASSDNMAGHEGGLEAARARLALLDVPPEEIARLEREKKAVTELTLRAPVSGTVLERGVTEGQYVGPSTTLMTLADLSSVWLLADVYEMDLVRVKRGDLAAFTSDALPGRTFSGRVDFIYPTVSAETRTVKARVVLANPAGELKPGMYGRVRLATRGTGALSVPAEAVIRTGEHDYVFIMHPGGRFEPRRVRIGRTDGDRVEIREGLEGGETVVASASFLIDSESRLRAAVSGMSGGESPGAHAH
jgi:Cu(I)/Ag(I) efflux system membrane fusion protein